MESTSMKMKKLFALCVLSTLSFAFNAAAYAHGSTKPLHGGVVQMVGETSFELVTRPDGAEVYLIDDGDDMSSEGLTGKLMIDQAGTKTEAALAPAGGNKLEARGAKIPAGAKVVVLIILKDASKLRATFSIP
jgi:hypothetical protein